MKKETEKIMHNLSHPERSEPTFLLCLKMFQKSLTKYFSTGRKYEFRHSDKILEISFT